jgi:hypothetical protein
MPVLVPSSFEEDHGGTENDENETAGADPKSRLEKKCTERDLLSCLVEVVDTDMGAIFKLRRQIQDGNTDHGGIAYGDLWHLFKPGGIIVPNPSLHPGPQQAYCVLHVTGGRLSHETPQVTAEPSDVWAITGEMLRISSGVTPFVLDCIFIDYDGAKYGPRAKCVALQDYNGLKPIKSLEVFPVRFNPEPQDNYTSLVERGKHYAGIRSGVSKLYKGLTLGEKVEKTSFEAAVEVTQRKEVTPSPAIIPVLYLL